MTKLEYEQQLMRDRLATGQPETYTRRPRGPKQPPPVKVQKPARVPRPPRDLSEPVDCAGTPVRELLMPLIGGVYMLYEDGLCYIGESVNIMARLANHMENIRLQRLTAMDNPRCCLLMETKHRYGTSWNGKKAKRMTAEDRFIVAALNMGLKLTNKLSETTIARCRAQAADLEYETTRLQAALDLLSN